MGAAAAPEREGVGGSHGTGAQLDLNQRVYAGLLRAYPARFRADYEDEMVVLFGDQLRDARASRGTSGVARAWIRTLVDLASTALGEHLRKERDVAQSLATFEPTRSMRLLGLVGLIGGFLLLVAYVSFAPFESTGANTIRLILFCLGGAAVAIAFHARQSHVAPTAALLTTGAVVISGLGYATWLVAAPWVPSPFMGPFGTLNFWLSAALWLTAAAYGAAMLWIGAAWQGMPRWMAIVTRVGAISLLGSVVAWTGDDRLGLVDSNQFGQVWSAAAMAGVFLNGLGWVILGSVLAFGSRSGRPAEPS